MDDNKSLIRNLFKEEDDLNTYIADFLRNNPLPKKPSRKVAVIFVDYRRWITSNAVMPYWFYTQPPANDNWR
jgi:hypothetical protein